MEECYCDKCGQPFTFYQPEGTICTSCESESQEKEVETEESKEYWANYQEFLVNLA